MERCGFYGGRGTVKQKGRYRWIEQQAEEFHEEEN